MKASTESGAGLGRSLRHSLEFRRLGLLHRGQVLRNSTEELVNVRGSDRYCEGSLIVGHRIK